jgi:hypothetical protein
VQFPYSFRRRQNLYNSCLSEIILLQFIMWRSLQRMDAFWFLTPTWTLVKVSTGYGLELPCYMCCLVMRRFLYFLVIFTLHISYTAKTKCRKFETNISRKGISGPQSQFPHSCVCERIMYRLILWIYKSLKDTWMWKFGLRPRYSQKRNI